MRHVLFAFISLFVITTNGLLSHANPTTPSLECINGLVAKAQQLASFAGHYQHSAVNLLFGQRFEITWNASEGDGTLRIGNLPIRLKNLDTKRIYREGVVKFNGRLHLKHVEAELKEAHGDLVLTATIYFQRVVMGWVPKGNLYQEVQKFTLSRDGTLKIERSFLNYLDIETTLTGEATYVREN